MPPVEKPWRLAPNGNRLITYDELVTEFQGVRPLGRFEKPSAANMVGRAGNSDSASSLPFEDDANTTR